MTPIRLLVVDDHALFRRGLVSLLEEMPGIEVIAEAGDGRQALNEAMATRPDVVLLDVNMPVLGGVAAVSALRERGFKGAILMLTISKNDEDLIGAITSGADGYLLKNMDPEELVRAIQQVYQGKGVLSPEITRQVMNAVQPPSDLAASGGLSDREREVLQLLSQGLTTGQIAASLGISENTVKTHVRHILEKLEAANRTEAVRIGLQLGLIESAPKN